MANGDTIQEIKTLLSEKGAIKTPVALRLTLDISAQIYEKFEIQEKHIKELEAEIKRVKDTSIVLWVQNNPKFSLFLLALYFILSEFVDLHAIGLQIFGSFKF